MKPVIDPNTQSLDDRFVNAPEIILCDHMPPPEDIRISVQGKFIPFKNSIIDLFDKAGISYADKKFVSDHYLYLDDFNVEIDLKNNYFIISSSQFLSKDVTPNLSGDIKYKFSFMSNKCRSHRKLCATVIANMFNTDDICYSYLDQPNDFLVSELLFGTEYDFDKSKCLSEKFFFKDGFRNKTNYGAAQPGSSNTGVAYEFMRDKLFSNAATSIITEPCFFERGPMLTEKTLMAIYSGHFMIWPGAWDLPDTAKRMGLDIFDDIIDHSYQHIEHPGKRVVEAFVRNKDFLEDIDKQIEYRSKNLHRILNNINIVRDLAQLKSNMASLNINTR